MSIRMRCHTPKELTVAMNMVRSSGVKWLGGRSRRQMFDEIMSVTFEWEGWIDSMCVELYVNVKRNTVTWNWDTAA